MGRGERNHMKKENNFLDQMGEIDEKFVYEASLPWEKRNVNLKLKLAKIAAARDKCGLGTDYFVDSNCIGD